MTAPLRTSIGLLAGSIAAAGMLAGGTFAQDPAPTPRDPSILSPGRPLRPPFVPRIPRVWTVRGFSSEGDFATIQEAIDHAQDGDIVYVKNGSYVDFTIDGKSLTLIGEADPGSTVGVPRLPRVQYTATIKDLYATGSVVIRGFARIGTIDVSDCVGTVWVEEMLFGHLYVRNCESVVVTRIYPSTLLYPYSQDVVGSNSNVAVWDSYLYGEPGQRGAGTDGCTCDYCALCNCAYAYDPGCGYTDPFCYETGPPGDGEPAVWLMGDSSLFLSGSTLTGGWGGRSYCNYSSAAPGPAVRTTSASMVTYLDTTFSGGAPLIVGDPALANLARTSGSYTVSSPLFGGEDGTATLAGKPDTGGFVVANPVLTVTPAPLRFGVLVVRLSDSTSMYLGTVPPDGSPLVDTLPVGNLGPGEGAVLFMQSMFVEDLGGGLSETVLGAPSVLVQID